MNSMKINLFLGILLILAATIQNVNAQNEDQYMISVVANDTILDGNHFEYKIIIRNMQGDFTPPLFESFDIVGGPNLSSSMQYNNGTMFREKSYSYFLQARNVGQHYIEEAILIVDGKAIETEAIPVFVVSNPEMIKENYRIGSQSQLNKAFPKLEAQPQIEKKKKKPLKKI